MHESKPELKHTNVFQEPHEMWSMKQMRNTINFSWWSEKIWELRRRELRIFQLIFKLQGDCIVIPLLLSNQFGNLWCWRYYIGYFLPAEFICTVVVRGIETTMDGATLAAPTALENWTVGLNRSHVFHVITRPPVKLLGKSSWSYTTFLKQICDHYRKVCKTFHLTM